MKEVNRTISAAREEAIMNENKSPGFKIAFGDKSLFSTLRVTITRELLNETKVFEISSAHLPDNRSNTTNFRLVKEGNTLRIKWCSKIADNMKEVK